MSAQQSGQVLGAGSQSLLTAASLASVLGMQLSTLTTSPPTSAPQAVTSSAGGGTTSSQTMMVRGYEEVGEHFCCLERALKGVCFCGILNSDCVRA